MLMVVIYMIIVFSLNLKGVTGILTGLMTLTPQSKHPASTVISSRLVE